MSHTDQFDTLFADSKVMAILRGAGAKLGVELSERAWRNGIEHIEIPIQSHDDLRTLEAVRAAADAAGKAIGAGTIVSPELASTAADYGAKYTVCPGLDSEVVDASHAAGLPCLAGVATPTDVQRAARLGLTWVKAFPAAWLGPTWFKAIRGPFPAMNFVATGGISSSNAREYLDAGARMVAVGSALADQSELDRLNLRTQCR